MSDDAKITIINYVCDPLEILGILMLVTEVCLKIYRTVNKQAYPSQSKWGEPELLAVIGFFVFALIDIASGFIFPIF